MLLDVFWKYVDMVLFFLHSENRFKIMHFHKSINAMWSSCSLKSQNLKLDRVAQRKNELSA